MKTYTDYRGWEIRRGPTHPITGAWRASRAGVDMGACTKDILMRMIDARVTREQQERDAREAAS